MLRSMFSGMSGLKAHQTKMDVIGNNIANVNTYGFRSSRVSFRDVYYQTIGSAMAAEGANGGMNASQIGYGSMVSSIDISTARSSYTPTGYAMDCYINGEGYFAVRDSSSGILFTRVGMLGFDGSGNLVEGTGKMVLGYPVAYQYNTAQLDGATVNFGQANGTLMEGYSIRVVYNTPDSAEEIAVTADSDAKTITITYTPDSADPGTLTNTKLQDALQGTWTWDGTEPTDFDTAAITVDQAATAPDKTVSATNRVVSTTAGFDQTVDPGVIVNPYEQLVNLSIDSGGTITGQTPEGKVVVLGRVALANIPNPQAMEMVGESMFRATANSGDPSFTVPGGNNLGLLKTQGLEMSTVDLSNEFSEMITTQRGFQACSKIITVSDEMLEILVNLKR